MHKKSDLSVQKMYFTSTLQHLRIGPLFFLQCLPMGFYGLLMAKMFLKVSFPLIQRGV
jgi:hypothetical protein